MKKITVSQIIGQLKYDLIGKDSYRGVTLSYAWLANQFSHFALGFIPTFCLSSYLSSSQNPWLKPSYAGIFVCITWLLFEIYNVIKPLLFSAVRKDNTYIFTPQWGNIIYDTSTDLLYFFIGSFTYTCIAHNEPWAFGYILCILITAVLIPSKYWYVTKMYQQYARYPFQIRLSQWKFTISKTDKTLVENFLSNNSNKHHLLISGQNSISKTSLGVAIANEFSIKGQRCIYVTTIKLFGLFFENKPIASEQLWDWRMADVLVIDDTNPASPNNTEVINPSIFNVMLQNEYFGEINVRDICNKRIIWILGNHTKVQANHNSWVQLLNTIGIAPSNIHSVYVH